MPGTTLRARPRAFGLQPGGSDDFPERTEPAVFSCDEPGNDRLKDPLSRKLPGPEREAEIGAGRSQALLRLVAASLPLPLHEYAQAAGIRKRVYPHLFHLFRHQIITFLTKG